MSAPYAALHETVNGPGDARPTALQILNDNNLEGKLTDKVALVTGCSSGIGIETARVLKIAGMRVFAAVRNLEKGKKALGSTLEPGRCELVELDLDSLSSVRKCAAEILSKTDRLNILVNNAGIMACPEGRTPDGFERQFGTNHLAHFLLFNLLKDLMLKSATPDFGSRVVNVSSSAHRYSPIVFDNLNLEGIYDPEKSYGQSKTANIYMANEIERRYGAQDLHAFSLNPGAVAGTGLGANVSDEMKAKWATWGPEVINHFKSIEQGAATQIWAAIDKGLEGKGGLYLNDCGVANPVLENSSDLEPGYAAWAYNEEAEKRLWKVSMELVGLEDE